MKQKGITLVALIVTIVLMFILAGSTLYVATNVISYTSLQNVKTNMLFIQAKVKMVQEKSNFEKDENLLKGTKISEIQENEKINKLIEQGIIKEEEEYYLLSKQDLEDWNLEDIQIEDGFLVSYQLGEVVSLRGYPNKEGSLFYKLSDMINLE